MLSDSLFQFIDDLLEAVVNYEYSDDFREPLVLIISGINNIRDDLDKCGEGHLLRNDKLESMRLANKMYDNAIRKREMSGVDLYEGLYEQ